MPKLVSIIIPTFERPGLLAEALESCFKQTYSALEIIVVDDAPGNATQLYVEGLKDARLVYIRKPRRIGMVGCFNAGFERASGAYMTWICDDDLFMPEAIERLVQVLEREPDTDLVYGDYAMIDAAGAVLYPGKVKDPEHLDKDNYVGHAFLYRRKVYEIVGPFTETCHLNEDYECWLKVRAAGFRMKRIPTGPLLHHRIHPASLTVIHGSKEMLDEVARTRQRFIPAWKHYFFTAERACQENRRLTAFKHILVSLVLRPWHGAAWRVFCLAVFPQWLVRRIRTWKGQGG
jgi:glycosyltransferase involved in cell wall biosynthesis